MPETALCLVKKKPQPDRWLFEAVISAFKDALVYPRSIAGILLSKEDNSTSSDLTIIFEESYAPSQTKEEPRDDEREPWKPKASW